MKLLWIDDDKIYNRFRYEERKIRQRGWDIDWAISICMAAEKLSENVYDVIFLDQQLPFDIELNDKDNFKSLVHQPLPQATDIWSGNIIYSWLFSSANDLQEQTNELKDAANEVRQKFKTISKDYHPKPGNLAAKILILTGTEPKHYTTFKDRRPPNFCIKPLNIEELTEFLARVESQPEHKDG